MNWFILALSLVAGVAGTGLGGLAGALLKNGSSALMGRVLSFAGGVMLGVVAFEMLPESIEAASSLGNTGGVFLIAATVVLGMAVIFGINKLLDFIEKKKHTVRIDAYRANAVVRAQAKYAFANERAHRFENAQNKRTDNRMVSVRAASASVNGDADSRRREMIKAGTVMLFAIALHNFPEGMAIGAAGAMQSSAGVLVAIIIALHNIPEGMVIAAPLVSGGVSGVKAVLLTSLAGFATVIGAVLGLAVGGLGALATGICLALAGGAMLYVTVCEILPQSIDMAGGRVPSASLIAGILCAMLFVFLT